MQDTNALERLAKACRILEMHGHGDLSLGHVSLRDPDGRGFWLKRNRAGLGEIRGPEDFVLVSFDGEKLAGAGGRHSEWPIHSEILKRRRDVQVVAHTHALHASVLSGASEALQPYTLDADYFVDLPVTFCGTSIEHATCVGVFLEKACKAHLLGKAAGLQVNPLGSAVRGKRHAQIMTPAHIEHSWDYFCRMLDG
ncbi:MAG: hypothetical protein A3G81_02260 [Betaproteobacteria bacterium RIFCSPLOWO2_12_FULL_65_14]|nr:MAG: hypothetical protein A3G81_02260 [Betaproteobacteria bacterium RIFCSPLOWO2_12_FULL_65_14]